MERNAVATAECVSVPYTSHTSAAPRRRALQATPRHDLYRNIHAGLRVCMSDALAAVGRMDGDDPADMASVTLQVNELIVSFAATSKRRTRGSIPRSKRGSPARLCALRTTMRITSRL
jgi:hypothetical protein